MNSRKYKSDINELIEKGKAIMNASDDSKYLMRVFAVNMVLSGSEVSKVSEISYAVLTKDSASSESEGSSIGTLAAIA